LEVLKSNAYIRDTYMNQNNSEIFELDNQYSSTRCVTRTPPVIVNDSEGKIHSVLFLPDNSERYAEGGLRTQGYFKHNQAEKPLISVITVVFNGVEYIKQTINSVIGQTYDNVEYIIIDGGSTDGTLDKIRQYEKQIDYWVSEPDKGIYDAMNKAAALATGKWINFMNAGDSFHDNGVVSTFFNGVDLDEVAVVYGDVMNVFSQQYKVLCKSRSLKLFYKGMQGMPFSHQSAFVKTAILKNESFDQKYHITADYDFFYKLYQSGLTFLYQPKVVANFDMFGTSTDYVQLFKENKRILLQYEPDKISYLNHKLLFELKLKEIIKSILPNRLVTYIRINLSKFYNIS